MSNLVPTLKKYQVPLIGALLALVGFFLSWITVPLGDVLGGVAPSLSAFSLATLGRSEILGEFAPESRIILLLWLFLAIPVISLILGFMALQNPAHERIAALGHFAGGLVGLSVLFAPLIYFWVSEPEAFAAASALVKPGIGLWLTIIGLLVMLVSGYLLYLEARKAGGAGYYDAYPQLDAQPVIPIYSPPIPTPTTESSPAIGGVTRATDFADLPPIGAPATPSRKTEVINKQPKALAWLVVREGARAGHTFNVAESTSIGRDADNDIIIDDTSMSGQHAKVKLEEGGQFMLYDLASTNGVFAYDAGKGDWERVYRHPLVDGQQIKLGRTILSFMHLSPDVPGAKS